MELLVISSPSYFDTEIRIINTLFDQGLQLFHLRKPGSEKAEYIRILNGVPEKYRNRVAVHQHHGLSEDLGVRRLHYSEEIRKTLVLPEQLPGDKILSTSIHRLNELHRLQGFEYALISPLFDSYSKLGYKGIAGTDFKLTHPDQGVAAPTRIMALGGIGINTIGRVKRMGFDGVAMLGWIWNDPTKAIENFKQVQKWIGENT